MFVDAALITEFTNRFMGINYQTVFIMIHHKLYGNQKIKCVLDVLFDGERIGCFIDSNAIYVKISELIGLLIKGNEYIIESEVMKITISKIK